MLREIDDVLGQAGWKRVKAPHIFPSFVLWGNGDEVSFDFEQGTKVIVESEKPLGEFEKLPVGALPQYIQAAAALNRTLA